MTDLALTWDNDPGAADLLLAGGALETHDGMRTAILISLFSDARAPEGMALPELGADRRGWWGNDFSGEVSTGTDRDERNHIGSLLWTLGRAKVLPATIESARQFAYEALAWLLRDGVVKAMSVEVEAQASDGIRQRLAIGVTLERPEGPARERHDFTWEASA